ncbi:MAG: polyprenyl synthetase family protein [Bauldia sp.]|nr:MAG: polyprenyl synthetase family protein [Bauldia sp.]MBZ0230159.1 polyprenyl synthetase family protein [Bauldia sp.]
MKEQRDFSDKKKRVREAVESFLTKKFADYPDTKVCRAAKYAVLGGGHRWRPIVAVAAGEIFDPGALEIGLPGACGVELAHAASLVLDDLPSMDDADLRRGKEATHRVFPAWAVDMAPVFLVTMAYQISLNNNRATADRRVRAAQELSRAGLSMIFGQVADVQQEHGYDEGRLLDFYMLKSGALYAASGKAGAILCGASRSDAEIVYDACMNLGVAYQIMDDVADVTTVVDEIGKRPGKDVNKVTAINLFGVDGARRKCSILQERGLALLSPFGAEADWLRALILEASWKTS